jgi:hypothetical protein
LSIVRCKMRLELRPSVLNPYLWYPERETPIAWEKIRRLVLEAAKHRCRFCGHRSSKYMQIHHLHLKRNPKPVLIPACVACHAVLHIGRNLGLGTIEIWRSRISQREIVRKTREGIRRGQSLRQIKASLPISRGDLPPTSVQWANRLLVDIGSKPSASIKRPHCAVFVNLKRWQLEDERRRERVRQLLKYWQSSMAKRSRR